LINTKNSVAIVELKKLCLNSEGGYFDEIIIKQQLISLPEYDLPPPHAYLILTKT
jgi:hypothetical protein